MDLFLLLLLLLAVTHAAGEVAARLGQPPLVGQLLAGLALGLTFSLANDAFPRVPPPQELSEGPVFRALTDLGVFFLMLLGGLELAPRKLAKASGKATVVALAGFLLPLAAGFALAWVVLPGSSMKLAQALLVGAALAITAVPVAVKVLMDFNLLDTKAGQTIVSAAVIDDVLSLFLLAALLGVLGAGGELDFLALGVIAVKVVAFFAITSLVGWYVFPVLGQLLARTRAEEIELAGALLAGLAFAVLAEALGTHYILGAFMAGLFISRATFKGRAFSAVKSKLEGVTNGFLAPIFFASIGLSFDPSAIVAAPAFLLALLAIAFAGKILGAGGAALACGMSRREAALVGVSMSGRGAVELIVAGIGLRAGLFAFPDPTPPVIASLYSSIVIVAVVTTVAVPVLLRAIVSSEEAKPRAASTGRAAAR
jgi:Kef-type K+ transport system membrane component KefB